MFLAYSPSGPEPSLTDGPDVLGQEEQAQTSRGTSYRGDIWSASSRLSLFRPWFDYEPLSLSYIRPVIGYGPEMFKYTFPLETPLGGLLSQAHNFFIHHWVEQGCLGTICIHRPCSIRPGCRSGAGFPELAQLLRPPPVALGRIDSGPSSAAWLK